MVDVQEKTVVHNALNWFEIPAVNIDRAAKFYTAILDAEVVPNDMMGMPMAFLPASGGGVGGALMQHEEYVPSKTGAVVYLNGGDDLNVILNRVETAGGKVMQPKMSIGENGNVAFFVDSEGNRVGLHSPN